MKKTFHKSQNSEHTQDYDIAMHDGDLIEQVITYDEQIIQHSLKKQKVFAQINPEENYEVCKQNK